ncbi:unnamed protein product [Spirodela intermedia]|uniref:Uncharacterized protein n=1 Tax=Spirodela intermedia TaxID=51605 RepID=A0A7I8LD65_SPIIN|nr:unnamed protein product [Spirodela intermedia]
MDLRVLLQLMLITSMLSARALGKECTNIIAQSHSLRYQVWATKNEEWRGEMDSHHDHLNPTEESTWMDLLSRDLSGGDVAKTEFDWTMLYRSIRRSEGNFTDEGSFLREMSLHDVRLDPDSKHGRAQQTNLDYLLMLDVDRLVWSFRKQARLPAPGNPYGGWESPNMEIRGHFVGHYLSASAKMWASTHNASIHQKMTAVVDALYLCQKKMGSGYLSAFSTEYFDRLEADVYVWAPYYTIHKILAGLLDQFSYAGNARALEMTIGMADYFANRVKNVIEKYSIERHWLTMNEETGGMNDALYNLYSITGNQKHLILAHLFDKPCFLGLLAIQSDSLSGFHANTHIPLVIGAQKRYEVTGDPLYKDIGTYFMEVINSSHSYATGGTSVNEIWSDPNRLADTLQTENEESCTTHNMLKVSRNLFRWTRKASYAEYYERALTNGVLSIQRGTDPGVMIYMLPLGVGVSKARSFHGWGTRFDSFWCCYGTGIESFSKLGDSIYFEDRSTTSLYIAHYVSSSLKWKSGGLTVNQKVQPVASQDAYLRVELTFSSNQSAAQSSELNLRIPSWTSPSNAKATLNNEPLDTPPPGNFLSVRRNWASTDVLSLQLPISLRTESIKDDRRGLGSVQAVLFGPYLLAGLTRDDWELRPGNSTSISDWIRAVPAEQNSQLITFTQEFDDGVLVFSNSNYSIAMEEAPSEGSDAAVHASFRAIAVNSTTKNLIMLEPFDLPGMVVAARRPNGALIVSGDPGPDSTFRLTAPPPRDGNPNSAVSLESSIHPGCFVHGAADRAAGKSVRLVCQRGAGARKEARFEIYQGTRAYDPISFVGRGTRRNFLLEPLINLKDETYTVYFNISV